MGRSFAAANTSHYSLVRAFDLVYTRSPLSLFKLGIVKQHRSARNAIVSPLYGVFSPVNRYVGAIVEAYFDSPWRNHRFLEPLSQKGAKNTIQLSNDRFLSGELYLPTDEREQRRIADCLASLDDVIAAQAQKVEALKAHKQGLMQQLFPRDGETMPRLRFPEFRGAPEWTSHRLAHFISALDAGVSVNAGDGPAGDSGIGVLKTSCVSAGVFQSSENKVVLEPTEIARVCEPVRAGTIIINRSNTSALVGANAYVDRDCDNLFLSDKLWAAKPSTNGDLRFVSYVLSSRRVRAAVSRMATGSSGSMKNISKPDLMKMELSAPHLSEQRRIAECLLSIDADVSAACAKLTFLESHKQALMQQLFPSATA